MKKNLIKILSLSAVLLVGCSNKTEEKTEEKVTQKTEQVTKNNSSNSNNEIEETTEKALPRKQYKSSIGILSLTENLTVKGEEGDIVITSSDGSRGIIAKIDGGGSSEINDKYPDELTTFHALVRNYSDSTKEAFQGSEVNYEFSNVGKSQYLNGQGQITVKLPDSLIKMYLFTNDTETGDVFILTIMGPNEDEMMSKLEVKEILENWTPLEEAEKE